MMNAHCKVVKLDEKQPNQNEKREKIHRNRKPIECIERRRMSNSNVYPSYILNLIC